MRNLLVLAFILATSVAACGKKQAPASPSTAPEAAEEEDREERDAARPDDPDAETPMSSDPCEGGE